jgi:hypothetical protein
MKKAKDILNPVNLTRIVVALAILLTLIAVLLVITRHTPTNNGTRVRTSDECKYVVVVASGDTLSKLLLEQGLTHNDVEVIANTLKKNAGISTLRADNDKIEFTRPTNDKPVSKIVVIPSPWKQVELTCDSTGAWNCKTVDIERDTRAVYRAGEIQDGDSFYLAGQRAGIPAGILADVYDLLAFEMDFERDVRAGQKFWVVYEENFSDGQKIDNGRVLAVSFDALRGNVKMYRFRKNDGTTG